ncbi:MAG: leucine-rich repeat domain-containing protein [Bacteroidaceae bacterium]|nr:leucine-rich repeat domain-containing protein [Bacteroidaceae bacterium]
MKRNRLCLITILLSVLEIMTVLSCNKNNTKNNGQQETIITVDTNGKASGEHRFDKIDDTNFYIDDIRYTAQNGDLIVSGFDEAFFKGEAKLISQLNYDGRKMKVIAIGMEAFRDCKVLSSIVIPSGVTSIGDYAFYGCMELSSISFPGSVTTIGDNAFYGCSKLVSIIIPNGVTTIGESAFGACLGLTYVTIPKSVTSIGQGAFVFCGSLTHVKVKKIIPVPISFMTFTNQGNTTLYVPYGSKAAYETSEYWNTEFKEILEED